MLLKVFGVKHIADRQEMREQLNQFVEDAELDAIFLERRESEAGWKTSLTATAMNPSVMFWKYLYRIIVRSIAFTKNSLRGEFTPRADDEIITEELAEERDLSVYNVDMSIEKAILEEGKSWTILSWIVFLAMLQQISNFPSSLTSNLFQSLSRTLLFGGSLFITVSVFVALPFIFSGIETRNLNMMRNILKRYEEEGLENSLLVTGSGHTSGIIELADISELNAEKKDYEGRSVKSRIKSILG